MLNVDFDDFFHQITREDVFQILRKSPFTLNKDTANILSKVCTYQGRLPMGAPTSPVLSNLFCIDLDIDLESWSIDRDIIYTRFVDDLSFSSKQASLSTLHYEEISNIAKRYDLFFDPDKTKYYSSDDIKIVTGLIVDDKLGIPKDYYYETDQDIERLSRLMEVHYITGKIYPTPVLNLFKKEVMGKINFIGQILGREHSVYNHYLEKYEEAINPDETLSARWLRFSNYVKF